MNMKIAIIGGSGFVGTRLIGTLKQAGDMDLINIDKKNSDRYPSITKVADILDQKAIVPLLAGVDIVIHLAAEHRDDVSPVSLYYDVNVDGLRNVLTAMERNNVRRILFTSSVAIYGLGKESPKESHVPEPFNHYGRSKWMAEELLQEWYAAHKDWGMHVIRPTVIFGEGNRGNVYNLLKQVASGRYMMIGKGFNRKSMAYNGNIAAFIHFLIEHHTDGYEVYNYADKPDFTTNELVSYTGDMLNRQIPQKRLPYWLALVAGYGFDIIAVLLRRKLPISSIRIKKFCAITQYDSTKAMNCGFVPPFTMEEGLQRTLRSEFVESLPEESYMSPSIAK